MAGPFFYRFTGGLLILRLSIAIRSKYACGLLLSALLTSGCGNDRAGGPANLNASSAPLIRTRIFGKVRLDQPLKGGLVKLNNERFTRLSDLGNFEFPSGGFPTPLLVSVEAELEGQPVRLEAEVPSPSSPQAFVQVNVVTTLVSRYHKLHPELSHLQAEEKVLKAFGLLGRPDYLDSLSHPHSGFSEHDFLKDARARGSIEGHLDFLVGLVDAPRTSPKFDIDFAGLASGLGSAIGRFVATKALGWGLSAIGLETSNNQIGDALGQIASQLTQLKLTLDVLLVQVENLAASVLVQSITSTTTAINALNLRYQTALNGSYSELQTSQLIADILQQNTMIAIIDQAQIPGAGSTGLMELTARQVSPRFVTSTSQQTLQNQADYYQNFQLIATNLLVEAAHASNPVLAYDAENYLDQYYLSAKRQNSILQLTTFVTPSVLFPPKRSPNTFQDTILPWPPAPNLSILLGPGGSALPERLSPYPSIPDDLLFDLSNNRVWEFQAHGSMSLNGVPAFLNSYRFHGYTMRLPSLGEIQELRRSLDANTVAAFTTVDSAATARFSGYLWTRSSEQANAIQGSAVRNQFVYNFQTDEVRRVGPYTTDSDSNGPFEPQDPATQRTPLELPVLLVGDTSSAYYKPTLQMNIQPGTHGSNCTASLVFSVKDSDGNAVQKSRDVTDQVAWTVTINGSSVASSFKAHIENSPLGSGQLVFRRGIQPSDVVNVTATLGNLTATQTTPALTPDLTPQGLLLSPNRVVVPGTYPSSQRLTPTLVTQDGSYNNNIGTQFVTFSSSDPSVTISPGGTVTATSPGPTPKVVNITATYNDGVNPAVTGITTFTLQPI